MKIRVGHLLLLLVVGGVAFARLPDFGTIKRRIAGISSDLSSLGALFQSGETEISGTKETPKPDLPEALPSERLPADGEQTAAAPPRAASADVSQPDPPQPKAVAAKKPPAKKVGKRPARRRAARAKTVNRKKSAAARKKAAAKPAIQKPAVKSDPVADLIGTYVALELATGRDVKGILQAKTATHYVVELPGMGPFRYPLSNVRGVKAAD